MSKVFAIIDEPDCCFGCPFLKDMLTQHFVCTRSNFVIKNFDIDLTKRPDWCPLRELPERKEGFVTDSLYLKGKIDGWNYCLEEILGE